MIFFHECIHKSVFFLKAFEKLFSALGLGLSATSYQNDGRITLNETFCSSRLVD
jgi:hypothetical protein